MIEIIFVIFFFAITAYLLISTFIEFLGIMRRENSHRLFRNSVIIQYVDDGKYKQNYKDVGKNKLTEFNIDNIDVLKDYFYDLFFNFEMAYNNLDYSILKLLSTKKLYQNYYTGISLDLKAGQKKIINDIKRESVIIYELDSTTVKQVASVLIEISYIGYTLDKNGNVISGNRNKRIKEKFDVGFRNEFDKKEVVNCPNCGAVLTSNKCEFCHSEVNNTDFKISSIKKVVEK